MPNRLLPGYSGHLYFGVAPLDPPTVTFDDLANWPANREFDFIGDVSVGGNFTTVDTTTRQTARTGFTSEIDLLEAGEVTYTIQKRRLTNDIMLELVQAKRTKGPYSFLILSGDLYDAAEDAGAGIQNYVGQWGYTGNYTVNFSDGQPVQGIQTLDVTLKLFDNSVLVAVQDSGTPGTPEIIEVENYTNS